MSDVTAAKEAERALIESERRYSALFANKINAIAHCRIITGEHGKPVDYEVIQVNDGYELATGLKRHGIERKRASEAVPGIEDSSFDYIGEFGRIALNGGELSFEASFELVNRWFSGYVYSPRRGEFVVIFTDITSRKQAEERLRESEERLRLIIESASDIAIFTLDPEGRVSSWNSGAMRLKGYTEEEILGRQFSLFYNEKDRRAGVPERLLDEARGHGIAHAEGWRVRKDSHVFWADVTMNTLRNPDGSVRGFASFVRDFTERRAAARERARLILELEQKNRELERSNSELEQFAYGVSHDLQEPLRMVTTYVELLSRRFGKVIADAGGGDFIEFIASGTSRMQAMIRDILSFSRVSRPGGEDFAGVDLNEALEWAHRNLAIAISESGAEVSVDRLPLVTGDFSQLALVFQNLLGNAIKYRGTNSPRISISALYGDGAWQVSVRDNGPGIDPKDHVRIFGLFKRLHSAATIPGSGLGLAITRRIIERHKGRIWVESEPGKGATFRFTIPGPAPGQ